MSTPTQDRTRRDGDRARSLDVDWEAAGRWAGRLTDPGPTGTRDELRAVVDSLHAAARRALPVAVRSSGLEGPLAASGGTDRRAQVLVVDRPGWTRAAARSFGLMVGDGRPGHGVPVPATAEAAAMLALLAGRVLGQYDPFTERLLLVAPNVMHVERALSATAEDFRLWVCVHEQTHALQFAAAPWLRDHLSREVGALVEELTRSPGQDLRAMVEGVARAVRPGGLRPDWSLLDLALDEAQSARVERLTAVMSLLEGHADVAMDRVGARDIPSRRRLRARMEARRRRARGVDRLLRRLLGMDAKLAQYRTGAAFVRGVRRAGGRGALDAVWTGPDALPTPLELADPRAWVRRVHG
ncbi:zinc-dependent metalloprotease [Cellulomonas carbonis]|uniref:Coenzyme F420 biosynthesis-associated protein n=1 Tax=Cellulomonas carbonis T26 TaxID=947969 RepID=A0A0A0BLD8_9CELL|nr:zinc-dependent metalloprotease [Cellulomonas carbonis]KGM08675.1 hypothetical protein N868_06875 [Cellulomonas carbonis T26]GGC04878.1 hypothetical protein GCM10010972_17580 [Cellulomonas carbonis]